MSKAWDEVCTPRRGHASGGEEPDGLKPASSVVLPVLTVLLGLQARLGWKEKSDRLLGLELLPSWVDPRTLSTQLWWSLSPQSLPGHHLAVPPGSLPLPSEGPSGPCSLWGWPLGALHGLQDWCCPVLSRDLAST